VFISQRLGKTRTGCSEGNSAKGSRELGFMVFVRGLTMRGEKGNRKGGWEKLRWQECN